MSYYNVYQQYKEFDFEGYWEKVSLEEIRASIYKNKLDWTDYLNLLAPKGRELLEEMAQRANQLAVQHFGRTILLYTPMYIANHCVNRCIYCGFNVDQEINRMKLTMEEIEAEAKAISSQGFQHILVLTGESKLNSPVPYIAEAIKVLKKYFHSVSIEIYPLTEDEYREIVAAGAEGLTIYQEVYNEEIYDKVHVSGPKKIYDFRLDAPERGCKAGMRMINIGALLGLDNGRKESFFTGMHIAYLQDNYPEVEYSISLPRIRPFNGMTYDVDEVTDPDMVQIILAHKIFLPRVGVTMSTRERQGFRDNLIPLGITKMSAGVSTEVGGHTDGKKSSGQFDISDGRSLEEMKEAIKAKGYQPILKDWTTF